MSIVVVSTGGTIASTADGGGDATVSLSGEDLVSAVPELESVADVEVREFSNVPSQFLTLEHCYDLLEVVREYDADPSVDGVVVTQGTNTMEESSYFVDLCYDGDTPVVFTGAMRNPSLPSPDGPMNLLASARVATDDRAGEMGVLVAFGERIHTARDVSKFHTMSTDTFRSPEFGPLGTVDEDRVVWRRWPENPDPTLDPDRDALRRDVETVTVTMDMTDTQLRAARESAGLVLGTMGAGHVPERIIDGLRAVREADVPVFATHRGSEGRLLRDRYGYPGSEHLLQELDCYYSDLNLQKTRVKAIVALAADALGEAFERP
ncbi:asparaginase [Salinirubellus sp. GCM10025818]|uniref:asparaginase n=1 Tax=Salinirubellus TaxID=2162630 RepID=UPI0030CE1EC9